MGEVDDDHRGERDATDHVARNRAAWNEWAGDFVAPGERNWAADEPSWGIWGIPESELHVLPGELAGVDAIELGCGTGYVSAWLARRGARPVGIDVSSEQLATARRLQERHGLSFPLHEASAERLPFADASFDLAISEYGACLWADPRLWVPEAARVLRPGGRLIFLTNGTIMMLCVSDDADELPAERLCATTSACTASSGPASPRSSSTWATATGSGCCAPTGSRWRTCSSCGRRPTPSPIPPFDDIVSLEWARRWPCEEVWKARKRA